MRKWFHILVDIVVRCTSKENQSDLASNYGVYAVPMFYLYKFIPYGGKTSTYENELGLGANVILELLSVV
jgi:hypothetical protein